MLVLEVLVDLHRTVNFSFFHITGWGVDLDYSDIEWLALETNRDHSVVFEIAPKYCISYSFVDYEGYSISFMGFLPTMYSIYILLYYILFPWWLRIKHLPAKQETRVQSLGWEDPLEKEMATHSSTLAWRIPWTEEPGRLQSTGSQRVGHD